MLLGLLNIKHDNTLWLKNVLAEKCSVLWQAGDASEALSYQLSKPVELLIVQLDSEYIAPDFHLLLPNLMCPVVLFSTDGFNHTQTVFNAFGVGVKDYVELKGICVESATLLLKKIKQQAVLYKKSEPINLELPLASMIIAIGASTGGPASLNELIQHLPKDLNAALVVIQHLDGRFSAGLADWLAQSAKLKVKLITHNEKALAGIIYIAGADLHLHISESGHFIYSEEPQQSLFKPSINIFFESLSKNWRGDAIGILLTGMGQDGAQGMKLMKEKGWLTIAQDQASSVVYGMPKAAVLLQAVTEVLPLNKIATRLITLCGK